MNSIRHLALLLLLTAAGVLSSCSTTPEVVEDTTLSNRAWWNGDGVEGDRKMVIDLTAQRLRYFKGGKLVGVSPISSGKEGTSTINGRFTVLEKDIDHRSSVYGAFVDESGSIVESDVDARKDRPPPGTKFLGASMRYCMRIKGGFCMHEGYLPGYPASHGCIRLPTRMAEIFFNETPTGTAVEIVGHGSQAVAEDEIPLGHGQVAAQEPAAEDADDGEAEDGGKSKEKSEAGRRDRLVADATKVKDPARPSRYQSAREAKKKYKRGTTWYLD